MSRMSACSSYDPETNECMRRGRCDCNPPRCICGRFTASWEEMHPACRDRMVDEEEAELRAGLEASWA